MVARSPGFRDSNCNRKRLAFTAGNVVTPICAANGQGTPFCAERMTGKIRWKERGPGKKSASVTAAGGRLVLRWADGNSVSIWANS